MVESNFRPSSPLNTTTSNTAASPTPVPAYFPSPVLTTDQIKYRSLDVTCASYANLLLSTIPQPHPTYVEAPSPVFYVKNNIYPKLGPSVTVSDKDRNGEVLGFVKLRWGRSDLFGLGPCASFITWQKLRRVSPATHSRFEFEFNFGINGGGRRKFIWRRKLPNIWSFQPDLVLHEIVGWGVRGAWGHESSEILASFTGMRSGPWKRNGKLKIKRGVTGDDAWRIYDRGEKEEESWAEWAEWEKVVTLTAMAIVEAARKRSFNKAPDPKLAEGRP